MIYTDSHIHLCNLKSCEDIKRNNFFVCNSVHSIEEWLYQENFLHFFIVKSFGLHPQMPSSQYEPFLFNLLKEKKINAIGECGFDLFPDFKDSINEQIRLFEIQLDFSIKFNKPLIIHNRKGLEYLYRYKKQMKKLPSVIFHSWNGTFFDAEKFINSDINCFFSFGKQILNGNKKAIYSAMKIRKDRILAETDAPYQYLKNETSTNPLDIKKVYSQLSYLKNIPYEELAITIFDNFKNCFFLDNL